MSALCKDMEGEKITWIIIIKGLWKSSGKFLSKFPLPPPPNKSTLLWKCSIIAQIQKKYFNDIQFWMSI